MTPSTGMPIIFSPASMVMIVRGCVSDKLGALLVRERMTFPCV